MTICPWASKHRSDWGVPIVDAGFDLFWDFDPQAPASSIRGFMQRKMELLIPGKPPTAMDEKSLFFRNRGRDLTEFFPLYAASHGRKPTLAMMRSMLMEGRAALEER
ncbi:MAG: hypothetical protein R3C19_25600 [Planctomycetaceae bacterium]